MRKRRIRRDHQGSYYHLIARTAGTASERPFDAREKQRLVELIDEANQFFTVEILSYAVMSNHIHLVVHAGSELPSPPETVRRFARRYPDKAPPRLASDEFERLQRRLRNISELMKDIQMRFTCWFNRTRPEHRRGRLWGDRFKSVLLQGSGSSAMWSCIKYVELNPVRARIVDSPDQYRFSSWGRYCRVGRHPFERSFLSHARAVLGEQFRSCGEDALFGELGADMARIIAGERGADSEEILATHQAARATGNRTAWVRATRRVRFWTDGGAVGDRAFVQECYVDTLADPTRAGDHRCGRGADPSGEALFAVRRLQVGVRF